MISIEQQIAEYCELQNELHPEITPQEVAGSAVMVSSPAGSVSTAWWAGGVAAVVLLVIGVVGVFAGLRSGPEAEIFDPTATTVLETVTTVVEEADPVGVALSFARGRSNGDMSIVALLAEDAFVDIGPATTPGELAMEMRWQQATGLSFVFEDCDQIDAPNDDGTSSFLCQVSWTGAVASSLGHGEDTFEYSIDVRDGLIVSAVLSDLGDYSVTTWRPFLDWVQENHASDVATMYTSDWHAVLTNESVGLWRRYTAEFVSPDDEPFPMATEEFGDNLTVVWTQVVPVSVGEPFRVFQLPDGSYVATPADSHLAGKVSLHSPDGRIWTERDMAEPLLPDHLVVWLEGDWAATWPPAGQTSATTKMKLWHHENGSWIEIETPDDITEYRPPAVSGGTAVLAGLGSSRQVLIRTTDGERTVVNDAEWLVPSPRQGMKVHDVDLVVLSDGSFAAYVKRYDRQGEGEVGWLQPPVGIWTSADGADWEFEGDASFTEGGPENVSVYEFDGAVVAHLEFYGGAGIDEPSTPGRDETWSSANGVDWAPAGIDGFASAGQSPPRELSATGNGLLIGVEPLSVSADSGSSWIEIPEYPDDPDAPFAGFSIGGVVGDLFYHSGGNGLWIGYLVQR